MTLPKRQVKTKLRGFLIRTPRRGHRLANWRTRHAGIDSNCRTEDKDLNTQIFGVEPIPSHFTVQFNTWIIAHFPPPSPYTSWEINL